MFPRKIPRPAKRSTRWRSLAHCSFVRSHECSVPGCTERPIEVAHVRVGSGAGVGQKPDDWNTISLCGGIAGHHAIQHQMGERSFALHYGIDLSALADEFAAKSPKASEIRTIKRERGL